MISRACGNMMSLSVIDMQHLDVQAVCSLHSVSVESGRQEYLRN